MHQTAQIEEEWLGVGAAAEPGEGAGIGSVTHSDGIPSRANSPRDDAFKLVAPPSRSGAAATRAPSG